MTAELQRRWGPQGIKCCSGAFRELGAPWGWGAGVGKKEVMQLLIIFCTVCLKQIGPECTTLHPFIMFAVSPGFVSTTLFTSLPW